MIESRFWRPLRICDGTVKRGRNITRNSEKIVLTQKNKLDMQCVPFLRDLTLIHTTDFKMLINELHFSSQKVFPIKK